jgi:hypothetical protein
MNPRQFSTNIVFYRNELVDLPGVSYFNDQKTVLGTYVNNTTAIFGKGFSIPPNGLPAPTADNFDFYINGTLVERIGIVSFTDNVTTSTLVINPIVLEFSLEASDKIISIGKFN